MDVTARHLVEKQLNDSERRAREQAATLEITLAHMRQGLSMFDADGRLMVWNDRFVEIYGMSPDIIKQSFSVHAIVEHLPRIGYLEPMSPIGSRNSPTDVPLRQPSGSMTTGDQNRPYPNRG
jgi:PAS domain-containing protein